MSLNNLRELNQTREKLRVLERILAESIADTDGDPEVRDAERVSLLRQINKLKEEIGRFEARQPARQ
jgi:hypothetical protein